MKIKELISVGGFEELIKETKGIKTKKATIEFISNKMEVEEIKNNEEFHEMASIREKLVIALNEKNDSLKSEIKDKMEESGINEIKARQVLIESILENKVKIDERLLEFIKSDNEETIDEETGMVISASEIKFKEDSKLQVSRTATKYGFEIVDEEKFNKFIAENTKDGVFTDRSGEEVVIQKTSIDKASILKYIKKSKGKYTFPGTKNSISEENFIIKQVK